VTAAETYTQKIAEARRLVALRTTELEQAKTADETQDAAEELSEAQEYLQARELALTALNLTPTTNAKGEPINRAEVSRTATKRFTDGFISMAVLFMPVHMFVHLKEAYRLSWLSTL
jgi:hypothetical protein